MCAGRKEARKYKCFVTSSLRVCRRNVLSTGGLNLSDGRVDLLAVLVETNTGGRVAVSSTNARSDSDNVGVNSARDAVHDLDVELGQSVFLVNGSLGQVTNGSSLNNVADSESLDGLVLRDGSGAVGASHKSDVASTVLVTAKHEQRSKEMVSIQDRTSPRLWTQMQRLVAALLLLLLLLLITYCTRTNVKTDGENC